MKTTERIAWMVTIIVVMVCGAPMHTIADFDTHDTDVLEELVKETAKQTRAMESMAKSLETIAKNSAGCK